MNLTGQVQYGNQGYDDDDSFNDSFGSERDFGRSGYAPPGSPPGQFMGDMFFPAPKVSKVMDGFFIGNQDAGTVSARVEVQALHVCTVELVECACCCI